MRSLDIQLTDSGAWLDVPEKTVLKFTINNNIFYESKNKRSYNLTANLPLSPTNNKALGWLYHIGIPNSATRQFNAALFDNHIHVYSGILEVIKTASGYSINFQVDYGTIDLLGSETKLRNVPAFDTPLAGIAGGVGQWPTYPTTGIYACFFGLLDNPVITYNRMMYHYGTNLECVNLFHIIQEVISFCGWQGDSISGTFWSDLELQTLHFINQNEINGATPKQYHRLPDLTITELIDSLKSMFCIGDFYDSRQKTVKLQLLKDVLQNDPIDWSSKVTYNSIQRDWGQKVIDGIELKWSDQYYAAYEPEDLSAHSFAGWFDNDTFLDAAIGGDNEYVKVATENTAFVWEKPSWWYAEPVKWWARGYLGNIGDYTKEDIVGEYPNFASLPAAAINQNRIALVTNENWFYRSDGSNWHKYMYQNYKAIHGNGKRVITSKIAAPIEDRIGDELEASNLRTMGVVKNYGYSYAVAEGAAKNNIEEMPAMLSFDRGAGIDSQGNTHNIGNGNSDRNTNLSTPGIHDYNFNIRGNYRLTWETDNGLFKTFHEPWYNYVNNGQEVTFTANLTLADITNLDLSKPIHIHGITGFIRQIKLQFPLLQPAEVTIVKRA